MDGRLRRWDLCRQGHTDLLLVAKGDYEAHGVGVDVGGREAAQQEGDVLAVTTGEPWKTSSQGGCGAR